MAEHRPNPRSASGARSALRTAVVWDVLQTELAGIAGTARVVDLGGGTGGFAVRVAELGHQVTVVDPSPDALAALDRRAADADVVGRVRGVQGDASDLPRLVADGVVDASMDGVLWHGVLEVVDDPGGALAAMAAVLRPDGLLSVLVANRLAAVVARALAGHFDQARTLLGASPVDAAEEGDAGTRGPRRYTRDEAVALLREHGFDLRTVHGVRVFTDLVPSPLTEPGAQAALLALERTAADVPELAAVAAQLHLLARRG